MSRGKVMSEIVINDPEAQQIIVDLLKSRIDSLRNILDKLQDTPDDDKRPVPSSPTPITTGKRKTNKAKPKYRYMASLNNLEKLLKKHGSLSTYRIRELLKEDLNISVTEAALKKLLKRAQEAEWIVLDDTSGNWKLPHD